MAGKNAFCDPETGILVGWGYAETNRPGDVVLEVEDDFYLEPGKWRWDGAEWQAVPDAEG